MKKALKIAIVASIFENEKEFQIIHFIKNEFRAYIYDSKGEYLIGGEEVAQFIEDAIKLLINR